MEILNNTILVDANGKEMAARKLFRIKKYILYYFSASWCSKSLDLLAKIKYIYQESCKRKIKLEIIYVAQDTDEKTMYNHFKEKHGRWYAVRFGDPAIRELCIRFGVTHIPYLVVTKNDGTIVSRTAKEDIEKLGINALVVWNV